MIDRNEICVKCGEPQWQSGSEPCCNCGLDADALADFMAKLPRTYDGPPPVVYVNRETYDRLKLLEETSNASD